MASTTTLSRKTTSAEGASNFELKMAAVLASWLGGWVAGAIGYWLAGWVDNKYLQKGLVKT